MASTVQAPPPRAPIPPPRPARSLAGPVVLIIIGIVFLLGTMGVLHWEMLGIWFAHYWPLLIILWGVIKLIEYQRAQRAGVRARGIGAGGIFLLIVLIFFGLLATQAARFNWEQLRDQFSDNDSDFPFFGHTYNYDDQLAQNFPAGAGLKIIDDRGAVNVTVSQDNQIHVTVHKRVSAESQEQADQWNSGSKPQITEQHEMGLFINQDQHDAGSKQVSLNSSVLTLNANTHGGGDHWVATDMDVSLPRKASIVVTSRHGDVSVLGRDGDIDVSNQHGDVAVSDVNGKVSLHLEHSSARLTQIASDVLVEGRATDVSVEDVKGEVRLNGDFTENLKLSRIAKAVSFKTTRTELELAKLSGDLNLDSGDLQGDGMNGPLRLDTHSKDIRLAGISGDVHLSNANGAVELRINKLGGMQVENRQADIEIYLPENAAFQLDARARNGEIYSDFSGVKNNEANDQAVATGTVGGGGPTLVLNNEHGAIRILKNSSHPEPGAAPPGTPNPPKAPKPPVPPVPEATDN